MRPKRGVVAFAAAAGALGLFARLRTAAFPAEEMFRSFPSEDGYLMLTVARNIALGHGMSSAAGTLPTNGVQPLAALVQALCFWTTGGDRAAGIRLLLVVYTVVAVAAALLIHRLGLRLLDGSALAPTAALLAAATWFASPATLFHSMNMLESGWYAAVVTAVVLFFARGHADGAMPWPWGRCLALGGLLGLAFWTRNDAVFLMAAVGAAHLLTGRDRLRRRRAAEVLAVAGAALAVSAPWLLYNVFGFGGVVPVSGRAYLGGGNVAASAHAVAVALFEYASLVLTFEYSRLQHGMPFVAACAIAVAGAAAAGARAALRLVPGHTRRAVLLVPVLFALSLGAFYVFFFNAPHFVRRYLFPLSPFLAVGWGMAAATVGARLAATRLRAAAPLAAVLLLAHLALRDGVFVRGAWNQGPLFRSADWAKTHVGDETWVGAFQSGTVGFFHDRTINLDGKLNPQALAATRRGRLPEYVAGSPIQYVVDWASIVEPWSRSDPAVLQSFEWVERDPRQDFAVLGRRGGPRPAPAAR